MSGRIGAVRSSAWIWDFSSTHSTTAASGRLRSRPTTARTLSMNNGSGDSLKVSTRCGGRPRRASRWRGGSHGSGPDQPGAGQAASDRGGVGLVGVDHNMADPRQPRLRLGREPVSDRDSAASR
jgi:hypothetical protein